MPGSFQTCCVLLLALLSSAAAAPWTVGDIFATAFGRLHVIDATTLVSWRLISVQCLSSCWASLPAWPIGRLLSSLPKLQQGDNKLFQCSHASYQPPVH